MKTLIEEKKNSAQSDLPWLVFKLQNLYYTVNSRIVNGIVQLDGEITPVSSSTDIFRGIIKYREGVLPLLDMRRFFGYVSTPDEYKQFHDEMTAHKDYHVELGSEIERCVVQGDIISKSLDIHSCKLYSSLNTDSPNIKKNPQLENQVNMIKPVHAEFHKIASDILTKSQNMSKEDRVKYMASEEKNKLRKCTKDLLKSIDDMINTYETNYHEMFVVVSNGEATMGIIVDEVVAVDSLTILSDETNFPSFQEVPHFVGVAQNAKVDGEILLINEDLLLNTFNEFKNIEE